MLVGISHAIVKPLIELGRLAEAVAAGEEALDRARLTGNAQQLLAAHSALSAARLASGDVTGALREAEEAATIDAPPDFHRAAQPGRRARGARTRRGGHAVGRDDDRTRAGGGGDREAARAALIEAEAAFDGFGGRRRRDEAVRELRALGRRVVRAAPGAGATGELTVDEAGDKPAELSR